MGRYYLIKMTSFYDRLCGVISMMAAIFTVTWMQKNNELLAMLAAGISTYRVIRPVLISALIVSGLAVINQEFIMPNLATELQQSHDDDGKRKVIVTTRRDSSDITISGGGMADRSTRTIFFFSATIPVTVAEELLEVQAAQARYIPPTATNAYRGGWLLHGARVVTPPTTESYKSVLTKLDTLEGLYNPIDFSEEKGVTELGGPMPGDIYFLRSDLSFDSVTRKRDWYLFASTRELIFALNEPSNKPEWVDIQVFLHNRMIRPLASLTLLGLSLPLVLGGANRNMFVNLGFSLGTSGLFYAANFMCGYFGAINAITPELAAWIPVIGFGTLAVARWDTIRT
jgi:lipopolysaccharide export system permease protein